MLILPRAPLASPRDLRAEHAPLLRHMATLAAWLAPRLRRPHTLALGAFACTSPFELLWLAALTSESKISRASCQRAALVIQRNPFSSHREILRTRIERLDEMKRPCRCDRKFILDV